MITLKREHLECIVEGLKRLHGKPGSTSDVTILELLELMDEPAEPGTLYILSLDDFES